MVGGGPVTRDYAQDIGADGYGKDDIEALDEAKRFFHRGMNDDHIA
jgi:methanogenic corrinoid protein MtbC1